jgi:hypothetical protein
MASIDAGKLVAEMGSAAAKVLKEKWPAVRSFTETELRKIAETVLSIEAGVAAGTTTAADAQVLLDMQSNAARAVLLAAEGMSALAAEQAINAALDVAKAALNAALKIPIF